MKNQKKLLPIIMAGLLSASIMGVSTIHAAYYENSNTGSATYSWYLNDAGKWFKSYNDAWDYAIQYGYSTSNITDYSNSYNTGNRSVDRSSVYTSYYHYYCSNTGYYYRTQNDADDDCLYNYGITNPNITDMGTTNYSTDATSTVVSAQYPWFSSYTGLYYKTQSAAISASNNFSGYVTYAYGNSSSISSSATVSSTYPWYSSYTRRYYRTQGEAISASGGYSSYVTYAYNNNYGSISSSTYVSSTYPWYSSYTRRYYKTQSDAISASGGYSSYVTYAYNNYNYSNAASSSTVSSVYPWYSSYTRRYYKTQSDAITASNGYSSYVSYAYGNYDYYYGYNYGYPYYDYRYYDYNIADGTPYIYSNYGYAGWENIISYIERSVIRNTSIKITMNGATSIPSDLLQVIKNKGVTIKLEMDNGATWLIDGRDVSRVKKTDVDVEYNTDEIPDSLIKNCTTDAVSKVQIKAGSDGDLNFDATLSVKFSKKRSGKKVYAYYYDKSNNQLRLAASGTVQSNGYVSFGNIDEGGSYLLVVK